MANRYGMDGGSWFDQQGFTVDGGSPATSAPRMTPSTTGTAASGWSGPTPPLATLPSLQTWMTTHPSYAQNANPTDPAYIRAQLLNLYQQHGVQPTGRGTGPT